jgi:hypothetical protein
MAKIQFTTPEGQSGEAELTSELLTLGRAEDNSIRIEHESISSHHGQFQFDGSLWIFTDLGSTNGTSVAGQRIESVQMASGGSFSIGHVEVTFWDDESAAGLDASQPQSASSAHAGYGSLPLDRSLRRGFGPKAKPKSSGHALFYVLGLIGLGAIGYAIQTFLNLGA